LDPLFLVTQAESAGKIPKALANRVRKRIRYLEGATKRVERGSGLSYPPYYIEPVLPLAQSSVEYGQTGVLYARVIPAPRQVGVSILVQFTAALIAFGAKSTIEAVAAHEFTHYVDLVRRFTRMDILSDESSVSLFEAGYADSGRLVDPKSLFSERSLVGLLKRKFKDNLKDAKLDAAVEKKWIEKGLPTRVVPPDENIIRVGIHAIASSAFDPKVVQKISEIEGKKRF
jgi:hypothetical protein